MYKTRRGKKKLWKLSRDIFFNSLILCRREHRFNEIFTAFGVITAANSTKSVLKLTVNYQNLFLFFSLISPTGIFSQQRKHSNQSRVKYGTFTPLSTSLEQNCYPFTKSHMRLQTLIQFNIKTSEPVEGQRSFRTSNV